MEAEDCAQPLVAKELRHEPIDAAVALKADEIAGDARHVERRRERNVAKLFEADATDLSAFLHEAREAVDVLRREARDLGPHRIHIAAVVEAGAVGETDAIEGRHRPQFDIVGHLAPAERPKLFEKERAP